MDLSAVMQLNSKQGDSQFMERTTATARKLVDHLPMTGREKTTLLRERVASRDFVLCEVPINKLAVVERRDIMAAADRPDAPIVVDVNKNQVGVSPRGFVPPVIVIEGTTRLSNLRKSGAVNVLAWIGEEALRHLGNQVSLVGKAVTTPLPVAMDDRPLCSLSTMLANAGGGAGSTGTAGLGSTSLNYGSSGNMDKLGLAAKKSMKANLGLPPRANAEPGFHQGMTPEAGRARPNAVPSAAPSAAPGAGVGPRMEPGMRVLDAEAKRIKKIVTKYKKAMAAGSVCPMSDDMMASAPPGMEKTVKGLKKHFGKDSSSPFKVAWWLHNKKSGMKGCGQ